MKEFVKDKFSKTVEFLAKIVAHAPHQITRNESAVYFKQRL